MKGHSRKLIQKQNLQVNRFECVKTPPSEGPITEDTPYMLEMIARSNGRFLISTMRDTIIMAPQKTPAAPSPAIALPMMKTGEFGAAAHNMEPASNIIEEVR